MRRALAIIAVCILCLTGCTEEKSLLSDAIAFRADLVQAGGCQFTAEVTADYGDTVQQFTLSCQSDAQGTTLLTVIAPETLAGIQASITDDGGTMQYDGLAMEFGLLANGNVIPAAVASIVTSCWMKEYIASAGQEDTRYRVSYQKNFDEKLLIVDTYFEKGIPICAEVCYNNSRVLKMMISDFAFLETE